MAYDPRYFVLAIQHLRPDLTVNEDYEAYDDGSGPRISVWRRADVAQPTQDEIEAVDTGALVPKADVPQTATPRQARLALFGAGLLPAVENAVKTAGGATQITWEYATEFNRNEPLIATLGAALGLTDAQIDALFVQAAGL